MPQGRGRIVSSGQRCPVCKKGHRYTIKDPDRSREWKARAAVLMRQSMGSRKPLEGPLRVTIIFMFPLPKSKHRKRNPPGRQHHTGKVDLDNCAKLVFDAATRAQIWGDDCQVVALKAHKLVAAQGEQPGVAMLVAKTDPLPEPVRIELDPARV